MEYEIVLGLEVHIQLNTSAKMFCTCKNEPFASIPNTHVCPVCLGLPGAMPVANKEAFETAQLTALALGSELQTRVIFERKNYFYPDLPKGYQITCPHYPIAVGGEFTFPSENQEVKVRFREIHVEEDTAKSVHENGKTLVDCNKSGVPLLEIVTEPDFRSVLSAVDFCKEVQKIVRAIHASEADMEKGHMRLEANISLRKSGETSLPSYRVELKNINSFAFMKKALLYEVERQKEALNAGEVLVQETRGFKESTGKTFPQRDKEEAHDYRYFPEPDIPPIDCDTVWMDSIKAKLHQYKLPSQVRTTLMQKGISSQFAEILIHDDSLMKIWEQLSEKGMEPQKAASLVVNTSAYKGKTAEEIWSLEKEKISSLISDENSLRAVIEEVLTENNEVRESYKKGKDNAFQFLIGAVMKKTGGKADPHKTRELLLTLLKN